MIALMTAHLSNRLELVKGNVAHMVPVQLVEGLLQSLVLDFHLVEELVLESFGFSGQEASQCLLAQRLWASQAYSRPSLGSLDEPARLSQGPVLSGFSSVVARGGQFSLVHESSSTTARSLRNTPA